MGVAPSERVLTVVDTALQLLPSELTDRLVLIPPHAGNVLLVLLLTGLQARQVPFRQSQVEGRSRPPWQFFALLAFRRALALSLLPLLRRFNSAPVILLSGSLERSNVDITEELVNLITAQRNFQASAKAIETTTGLTQTIINIRM